jgi:hypothetical protein
MPPGTGVCRGVLGGFTDRCGTGLVHWWQGCGQTTTVGRGDVLNAAGEPLPEVKTVADLHSVGGAGEDALPVGKGAVAADDLDTRVLAEPVAELFRIASLPGVSGSRVVASTRRVP